MSRGTVGRRSSTARAARTWRSSAARGRPSGLRCTTAVSVASGKPKRSIERAWAWLAAPFFAARSSSGAVGADERSGSVSVAHTTAAIHPSGIR
jgi:hypothetical protein